MDCPACGDPIAEGATYCTGCGSHLQYRCRACRAINPSGSAFCHSCGASLSAGWGASPREARAAEQARSGLHCPRCSEPNEPGSAYCFSCGLPLDEPSEDGLPLSGPSGGEAPLYAVGRPAGFWIRVVASLIDAAVVFTLYLVLAVVLGEGINDLGPLETLAVQALYYTLGVSIWSTTVGKRAVGIYVLRPDGSKVSWPRAFARWLAYIPSALLLFAGYLMVAFRGDKRGLHDLIADTVVVYRQ